jgi:signal peptidase I
MIPTLHVGDFILVNKFTYGVRLPLVHTKVLSVNEPDRGEVMVFRYPENPSLDYIKRVMGTPGDTIAYRDKQLFVNGEAVPITPESDFQYAEGGLNHISVKRFSETLGGHTHDILVNPELSPVQPGSVRQFPYRENCRYDRTEFECKVPEGHYFLMGDNRDSSDSRYWGFVPSDHIVGKAFLIWWNLEALERAGMSIQ